MVQDFSKLPPTREELNEILSSGKEDFYKILELPKTAKQDEIKKKFMLLARTHHPDKKKTPPTSPVNTSASNNENDEMSRINNAYRILSNPRLRYVYDEYVYNSSRRGLGGHSHGSDESFTGMWTSFKESFDDEESKMVEVIEKTLKRLLIRLLTLPFRNVIIFCRQSAQFLRPSVAIYRNWRYLLLSFFDGSYLTFQNEFLKESTEKITDYLETKYPLFKRLSMYSKNKGTIRTDPWGFLYTAAKGIGSYLTMKTLIYPSYLFVNLYVISRGASKSLISYSDIFRSPSIMFHGFGFYLARKGLGKAITYCLDSLDKYSFEKYMADTTSKKWRYISFFSSNSLLKLIIKSIFTYPLGSAEVAYQSLLVSDENQSFCFNSNFNSSNSLLSSNLLIDSAWNFTKNYFKFSSIFKLYNGVLGHLIYKS